VPVLVAAARPCPHHRPEAGVAHRAST